VSVAAALGDARRYERQIDRLHRRYLFTRHLYELQQGDVSLARVVQRRSHVAKLLAKTVASGAYEHAPAQIREIRVDGKLRTVFSYRLTDLVVHGVVSELLDEAIAPRLSPRLYSYRKGVSWWTPVADFAAYVRAHRRASPDPRDRGLYVLRRDVDAYTDSIPVHGGSPLWPILDDALGALGDSERHLLECVVRPDVVRLDGGTVSLVRGVPTGQPVSCVLFNLYLHELDRELAGIPGAFYARYSDDFLFAHPDPGVVQRADATIDAHVARLELRLSEEKRRTLYLTGAGRPSDVWPEARGTTVVPFLGTFIALDGRVSLSRKKLRTLLRDLRSRALQTANAVGRADQDRAGRVVCSMLNSALDRRPGPFQQRSAPLVSRVVTDRRQLAQLDYQLARIVLEAVTGDRSVRAFRRTPYRKIRETWGLRSTEHARNRQAA
jgi:hypothetical protein